MAETDRAQLCVLAPLRLEASAARRGAVASQVRRTGMGHRRSRRWAQRAAPMLAAGSPVAVVGLCGGLDPAMQPGDIVVASALRTEDGGVDIELPGAELLAAWLADAGLPVHRGPLVSARRLATGRRRATLAAGGAIAVDMESAWLAGAVRGDGPPRPLAVVRVVLDTAEQEVCSWRALRNLRLARRRLAALMPVLERWADATGPRHVLLAAPRSFCAGVERAIQIVDRALDRFQPPVYVRRQIVHNTHVVERLQGRGAVFVDEVDEVPPDAVLVLAAHGVSPQVRRDAARRRLQVIDATCPLVAKVHNEAKQFADRGFDIVLVGHADHEEVVGTTGEVPDRITVVGSAAEADALEVEHPDRVAYITQTTLAVDEVEGIVSHLRERFPSLVGPRREDICYATQNRQEAVAAIAADVDLVLVVGSPNSSNSRRLAEVASRSGTPAHLVDGCADISADWLRDARSIGITAGASAPEAKVDEVIAAIASLGAIVVEERRTSEESVSFQLPTEVRP